VSAQAHDVLRYIDEQESADDAIHALGAIGLAMLAGADDRARVLVIREILRLAPEPHPADTRSVELLIAAIKRSRRVEVSVKGPVT
jgi:hypothetical protein